MSLGIQSYQMWMPKPSDKNLVAGIDDVYKLSQHGPHDKDMLVQSAMFLKQYLPAMLAKRVKDLQVRFSLRMRCIAHPRSRFSAIGAHDLGKRLASTVFKVSDM